MSFLLLEDDIELAHAVAARRCHWDGDADEITFFGVQAFDEASQVM